MSKGGNKTINKEYENKLSRYIEKQGYANKPDANCTIEALEFYIREKYQKMRFYKNVTS